MADTTKTTATAPNEGAKTGPEPRSVQASDAGTRNLPAEAKTYAAGPPDPKDPNPLVSGDASFQTAYEKDHPRTSNVPDSSSTPEDALEHAEGKGGTADKRMQLLQVPKGFVHADGCPADNRSHSMDAHDRMTVPSKAGEKVVRVEKYDQLRPDGSVAHVTRCMECGAHHVSG